MNTRLSIEVPFLDMVTQYSPIENISTELNNLVPHKIGCSPWPQFPYKPDCEFAIAHHSDCIFLKYFVSEDYILARYMQPNDLVYRDSCVEFFISFAGDDRYYNFEFNSLGTCFLGYSFGNGDMKLASAGLIKEIKHSTLMYNSEGKVNWELTLVIPVTLFYQHALKTLNSARCRANFYKCGDDLPIPHYLAWNNIESEKPNFHLPRFFGELRFSAPTGDQTASSSR
ncbi:MAG: carbohydrate-binding family 9-like protein [Mucilaginibacter sp.]